MHLHYNLYWHSNWNPAAFFILLVAANAGGVLPAAFSQKSTQDPTSSTCALVTDFNFIIGFSNNPCLSATAQVISF